MGSERAVVGSEVTQEFSDLIESGQLPSVLIERSIGVLAVSGRQKEQAVVDYKQWVTDAWGVLRDQNWDLFRFGGCLRKVDGNTFSGRLDSLNGQTTLSMRTIRDVEDGCEERHLVTFESNWFGYLKTPDKVTVARIVKSKVDESITSNESVSFDLKTGQFDIS